MASSNKWRLFVALPLPDAASDRIHQILAELSSGELPVRWVNPTTAHLTLHFLGENPPERGELLRLSFASATFQCSPFRLQTDALGVFPDERRPRVIWLGLKGQTDRLGSLHQETAGLLERLGFPTEERPLKAHITLGRVRDDPPREFADQLRTKMSAHTLAAFVHEPVSFRIDQVRLYRSYLERAGPRHELIATNSLRAN